MRQTKRYHEALRELAGALAEQDAAAVAAAVRNNTLVFDLLDMIEFEAPALHVAMNFGDQRSA